MTSEGQKELAEVERAIIASLKEKPTAITPITFPIHHLLPLSSLASPYSVTFDLNGDSIKERRQWVNPKAALLVWDSERTEKVALGLQLFGSMTWWMFWRNGYESSAALDNSGNGWLKGKELDGISLWHDKNGNRFSEGGEILPLVCFTKFAFLSRRCIKMVVFGSTQRAFNCVTIAF